MSSSIGPNNGKPIFSSWEQTQKKCQEAFGTTFSKLLTTFKDFGQKVSLQNFALLGGSMSPPQTPLSGKITGIMTGKGK